MKTKNAKCPKCEYEWLTRTKLNYITCPNCQRKFLISEKEVKENGK